MYVRQAYRKTIEMKHEGKRGACTFRCPPEGSPDKEPFIKFITRFAKEYGKIDFLFINFRTEGDSDTLYEFGALYDDARALYIAPGLHGHGVITFEIPKSRTGSKNCLGSIKSLEYYYHQYVNFYFEKVSE